LGRFFIVIHRSIYRHILTYSVNYVSFGVIVGKQRYLELAA
jgi:hypothetical protein